MCIRDRSRKLMYITAYFRQNVFIIFVVTAVFNNNIMLDMKKICPSLAPYHSHFIEKKISVGLMHDK